VQVKEAKVTRALKWRALSLLMRTAGRLSDGIALGYRRGFDSGDMLDYVYEDKARGKLLVGRFIDRIYLTAVGWRGIRNRRELLKRLVKDEVARNRAAGRETRIADVASGPGRYLLEVLLESGEQDVRVVCRDAATCPPPESTVAGSSRSRLASRTSGTNAAMLSIRQASRRFHRGRTSSLYPASTSCSSIGR
jgi:hypothetical protein